jgi:ATP-binding cassette, subfamily B, bacterial MsbA
MSEKTPFKSRPESRFKAMSRLLRELLPYRAPIGLMVFLGIVISAIQPVSVKLSQKIIDELQRGHSDAFFRWVPIVLVTIFLISGVAKYFHNAIRRFVTEKLILKLRAELFKKYLYLPMAIVDRKRTGEMLSNIQNDLAQISSGIDTLCDILKEPFTFVGLLGVAFFCDWRLALCALFAAPLVAFLFFKSGAAVKRYSKRNLEQFSDLISLSQESVTGSRVIKVFRLEQSLLEKFRAIQDQYFKTVWKSIKVQELATPSVELIGATLMAGIIYYGRVRISHGLVTTGELVAFLLAIGLCQMPIKQLNTAYLKLKASEAAAERIYSILDIPETVDYAVTVKRLPSFRQSIRYENVGLYYGEKKALAEISFEVRQGECVAFVGRSGSGKTSIIHLLPRLYEISEGSIMIDGVDVRNLDLSDVRSQISFVTQETFLFNDSLLENIRYGNPKASDEDVRKAAELAHCTDFIEKCPQGFHSNIGDRGVCLSGGERQRVAIARAILKGAPILLLDEATSNLDSHSETIVQSALETLMKGKTTFLVAHRFSTVRRADRIYVMEHGKILEEGPHEALVARNGVYQKLFQRQSFT